MYKLNHRKKLYWRVPASGSTNFLGNEAQYSNLYPQNDHDKYFETYNLPGIPDWPPLAVIRDPYEWCKSIYIMSWRAQGHWAEFCPRLHWKQAAPVEFIEALEYTQLDWYRTLDGELPEDLEILHTESFPLLEQFYNADKRPGAKQPPWPSPKALSGILWHRMEAEMFLHAAYLERRST